MKKLDIVLVGVGGQGTLLASKILGALALQLNYDVKVSEVHGMAQRGGSVVTYLRIGEGVCSPLVETAMADYVIAFEQMEAMRALPYLKAGGTVITSTQKISPMPVVMGTAKYPEDIMEQLKTGPYGRCVYKCDNDQPDHYVTTMLFEGGVTASFTMDAFTPWGGRRTRIMGTLGYIEGDGKKLTLYTFRDNKTRVWHKNVAEMAEYKHAGHGGGDHALARDFVEAVASQDPA
jgi:Pyruvate/2-oxoacid:ferredoxin oxidoreductase gamma subunit